MLRHLPWGGMRRPVGTKSCRTCTPEQSDHPCTVTTVDGYHQDMRTLLVQ